MKMKRCLCDWELVISPLVLGLVVAIEVIVGDTHGVGRAGQKIGG